MFWLILYYTSVVIIPTPYPTEDACHKAAEVWVVPKQHSCIPAPVNVGTEKLATEQFVLDNMLRCRKNHYTNKLECY